MKIANVLIIFLFFLAVSEVLNNPIQVLEHTVSSNPLVKSLLARAGQTRKLLAITYMKRAGSLPSMDETTSTEPSSDYSASHENLVVSQQFVSPSTGGSSGKRGEPTQGELVDRFKRIVTAAVELSVYIGENQWSFQHRQLVISDSHSLGSRNTSAS